MRLADFGIDDVREKLNKNGSLYQPALSERNQNSLGKMLLFNTND
ncbi:hypothetical protein [Lacihabitans sp. LS3-19]|nr:hypothetical protein [Lacihabitans sp. LS3-19]